MYLKSLEIQGFKSFPDKTVIHFGSDITAIVGPNGSGKSNISDAISWVMGEQSSRALRGARMEDVIFGGTAKRPQVGFAEASLILDNSDGALALETAEVMVTRRYYRSGESEYYINQQSARLRDINELFMDTGLGREGYSNIGQGRIDEILSLKSGDRREVFEEAAGISKFRHRKEETERRLAGTQENLVRIGDKIAELEMQVEPLREQAEKAQQYLALQGELRRLEVTVWLDSLESLAQAVQKAQEDWRAAAFILEQAHSSLDDLYRAADALAEELRRQDRETDQLREEIAALEDRVRSLDGEAAVLQANLENSEENWRQVRQELEDQDQRRSGIAGQVEQQRRQLAELDERREKAAAQLTALEEAFRQVSGQSQAAAQALAQAQMAASGIRARRESRQGELETWNLTQEEQAQRRQTLTAQEAAAAQRLTEAVAGREAAARQLAEAREAVVSAQNTVSGYRLRLEARAARRDELQKQFTALGVELDTVAAKARMLREMERDYEGYSKAVRLVMQAAAKGILRNVHGPVSQLLKTEERYTVAIETALGAAMQQIVVSAEEDAKAAIELLKRRDGGRATFLPIRTIRGRRLQESGVDRTAGFVGIASDLIAYDAPYDAIFQNLLGRTVVVETLDAAITMARKYANRFRIVTLDGQVVNAGGSMTGGSAARTAGILSRASQLSQLEDRQKALAGRREALEGQLAEAGRAAAEVEFQLSAAEGQQRQAEDEVLRLEGTEKQQELLVEAAAGQVDTVRRELAAMEASSAEAAQRRQALEEELARLDQEARAREADIAAAQADCDRWSGQLARLQEQSTAARMESAACEAEAVTVRQAMEQLEALRQAMEGDRAAKEALGNQYQAAGEACRMQLAETARAREEAAGRLEETRGSLREAMDRRAQVEARKTRTEKEAQDKNKDLLLMERESARLEQQKTTAQLEEKQLLDKLWETYQLTPSTAAAERVPVDSAAAANREIAGLKRKIAALGTPNLGAIDQFARVNERYEYLSGQRDDVLGSKEELEEIIRSITREMTEIFTREFGRINECFGRTFREMFGGGQASVVLDDPNDPLGCGIEIHVQPPGKQVKTITLLSGGEKAFVAIALYFAILQVRPTPFCLLDEIDAALDDNNVRRFAAYLRNLCGRTQFIVITHRRGTMEEADVLYGVTMQEQGISKILHIDLGQMERQLGIT